MKTESSLVRILLLCAAFNVFAWGPDFTARAADGPFALQFDGVDDGVIVGHTSVLNSGTLTFTAWIKTSQTNGAAGIAAKFDTAILNGWQVFLVNGALRAKYAVGSSRFVGGGPNGMNGGFVADGEWHHIAFIVDSGGGRLHVDGALRAFQAWVGTPGSATTTFELTFGGGPGTAAYEGLMDELTVWNKAMSAAEVAAARRHSFVGREADLRLYLRVSEGTGDLLGNSAAAGLGLSGGLAGSPAWVPGVVLAPAAMTSPADVVASHSARLKGIVSPGGTNTHAWFEWGQTTNYGHATFAQPVGAGVAAVEFGRVLDGLVSGVPIHFRAVASNALGVAHGSNVTVTPVALNLTQERRDHTATLLLDGKVLVTGGFGAPVNGIGTATNSAELFDPATGRWTPTSPMSARRAFHTATLLHNGRVLVVDAQGAELFDPATETWRATGRPNAAHNSHTATLLANGKVLVAGGLGNQPELYDPATGQWTFTGALNAARSRHTATLLPDGRVLVAGGENATSGPLGSAEVYNPATGQWTLTSPMRRARTVHTATLQVDGQVLVVGGADAFRYLVTAERFDPVTGIWTHAEGLLEQARGYHTATLLPRGAIAVMGGYPSFPSTVEVLEPGSHQWHSAPAPATDRWQHSATLLPSGQILLVGGNDQQSIPTASVEVYEPHFFAWTNAAPLHTGRHGHTATLLPNGRVLVAGAGETEVFSPAANAWSNGPALLTPRTSHTATLLPDGRVLVAGGLDNNFVATTAAELFNSATGSWTNTGSLGTQRYAHTATMLADGRVLVVGGVAGFFGGPIDAAELYDAAGGRWTNTRPMSMPRSGHTATLLPNGKVLVAGGGPDNFTVTSSAELYDPATGLWTTTGSMSTNRAGHSAALLPNGTVLVMGGTASGFLSELASAEIYDPASGQWSPTTPMFTRRRDAAATLLPGGRVLVAGGYGGGYVSSAELYDPAARAWLLIDFMSGATYGHTLTLMTNGRALVVGGWTGNGGATRAEWIDLNLGSQPQWQPQISSANPSLTPGERLVLGGVRFQGVTGGSYGSAKDSPANCPVVQLRSLESGVTISLLSTNWSATNYASLPVGDFPASWAMATMLMNGAPGASRLVQILPATRPTLTIEKLASSVRVRWPSPSTGYVLQEKPDLAAADWSNVLPAATDNGTNKFITVNPTAGRRFYRLFKP
jgi:N-acetylneuraminic acid mutarotase